MAHSPENYRNIRLKPADNGGFTVEYDELRKANAKETFSDRVFVGTKIEVFSESEGIKALNRIKELAGTKSEHKSDHKSDHK